MKIVKKQEDGKLILALEGRLDTVTAPKLEEEINAISPHLNELVLDLADIDYVSSAGLRVILAAQKKMTTQGSMAVANVCETVREVFDMTGFSTILTFC